MEGEGMIRFEIPGEPKGKARPRVVGKFTYTPETTVNYENLVKIQFISAYKDFTPLETPLEVNITVYYGIPKSYAKKNKEMALSGQLRPTKKPDCDNIAKIILDALNNIAYKDDSQVVYMTIEKWYAEIPRTEVHIKSR